MAKYIVQHRRGTAEQWASKDNIIPMEGELVIEIDDQNSLHKLKIGDGMHTYAELAYLMAGDEIVSQVLAEAKPRIITVTLDVDKWVKVTSETDSSLEYYEQVITLENITSQSRLDLQPDLEMIAQFQKLGIVFVTKNINRIISVRSLGNKPTETYEMQATIVETDVVAECDGVLGIPIGVPSSASVSLEETNARVAELESQMAELLYVPIAINTFSHNQGTMERGQVITDVILSWSINKTPTTLKLDDKDLDPTSTKHSISGLNITWDNNKTWKLTVTDEKNNPISKQTSAFVFYRGVYYGALDKNPLVDDDFVIDSSTILSLKKELRSNRTTTFPVNTNGTQWPVFAIPTAYGEPKSFNIGGLDYAWDKVCTFDFTNEHNYTESYDVWMHTRSLNGNLTIKVS